MKHIIIPYLGTEQIKFGMTSKEIQSVLGELKDSFYKNQGDAFKTDEFQDLFVYYKAPGVCEAIEFYGNADLIFNNISFFCSTYRQLKEIFLDLDDALEVDIDGFTSYKYGLGVYAPYADEEGGDIESVIIFEKNYYD